MKMGKHIWEEDKILNVKVIIFFNENKQSSDRISKLRPESEKGFVMKPVVELASHQNVG